MTTRTFVGVGAVGVVVLLALAPGQRDNIVIAQGSRAVPVFEVDALFPQMPPGMVLGGVGGVAADSHGNVWAFHRPHTLEEGNAHENGYGPAPPVVMFNDRGAYVRGWGGPSPDECIRVDQPRRTLLQVRSVCRPAPKRDERTAMDVREAASTAFMSTTRTTSG